MKKKQASFENSKIELKILPKEKTADYSLKLSTPSPKSYT